MSKKQNGKSFSNQKLQSAQQDYDLIRALSAIRKGTQKPYDSAEGTKTEIRIDSVNFNVLSNPEANSETDSQLGDKYVNEQYVQSIVNNLKADQVNSSTRLIEQFNDKIGKQNEKIDNIKEKCLSKSGFWGGIAILVSAILTFGQMIYSNVLSYREKLDIISTTENEKGQKLEKIEERVDSLEKVMKEISNKQEKLIQPKRSDL